MMNRQSWNLSALALCALAAAGCAASGGDGGTTDAGLGGGEGSGGQVGPGGAGGAGGQVGPGGAGGAGGQVGPGGSGGDIGPGGAGGEIGPGGSGGEIGPGGSGGEIGPGGSGGSGGMIVEPCQEGAEEACEFAGCSGTTRCVAGEWTECAGPVEVCDGVDNDCDGIADEDIAPEPCYDGPAGTEGMGLCTAGQRVCASGAFGACEGQVLPSAEACDEADNDCNGVADDLPGAGEPCVEGVGACAAMGATVCDPAGGVRCNAVAGQPSPEVCDAVDDDCDGSIDAPGSACYDGPPGTEGVGACAGGFRVCVDGIEGACDGEILPQGEICNGIDDDCNGSVDDGVVCDPGVCGDGMVSGTEDCDDGNDNPYDGCHSCQTGPVMNELMRCGSSDRNLNEFIAPGDGLVLVDGCIPVAGRTQAMLVTRGGVGTLDAVAMQTYLRAGGIVITEFSASDDVYNAVFGAAVVEGAFTGDCSDMLVPADRGNQADPFWQANVGVAPSAMLGCGRDMAGWGVPLVRLGGWNPNTTALAYVNVGRGRLWLVESDWQDTQGPMDAGSLQLMRHMIFNTGSTANVGSFAVNSGPAWQGATATSCVSACAQQFGGDPSEYACSTDPVLVNHRAFVDGYGDGTFCQGPGANEDFVQPGEGQAYDCGVGACSFSAWVSDHGCASVNYCHRRGVELGANAGFGAHGSCDTWNACTDAATCANAACQFFGYGPAISWDGEGGCQDLAASVPGGMDCNLFNNPGVDLDQEWGGFCNIPVVYGVTCADPLVNLGLNRGFGAHGGCDSWNACNDAATCAAAACSNAGHGAPVSWQEGLCTDLAGSVPGGMFCNLFASVPDNLDDQWGGGCNIPVVYDVTCRAQ